jgi:uncharacterized protein
VLIDIHTHIQNPRHERLCRHGGSRYPMPDELLQMMDDAGIDMAVLLCGVSPEWRYTIVTPEEVMGIAAAHPDRFIPFCNLDPRFILNSTESDFSGLLGAYKEMGCKGVGEYIPNLPFDDPLNMNLFKYVEASGLPLTFHIAPTLGRAYGCYDDVGLPRLEKVLQTFPDLTFLGHSQCFWAEIGTNVVADGQRTGYPEGPVTPGRVVELMRKYPNLHGDLSARSGCNAIARDTEFGLAFMEEFQDRLYWGTDIASPGQELPIVGVFRDLKASGTLSEEAFEKITWKNAATLLELDVSS